MNSPCEAQEGQYGSSKEKVLPHILQVSRFSDLPDIKTWGAIQWVNGIKSSINEGNNLRVALLDAVNEYSDFIISRSVLVL